MSCHICHVVSYSHIIYVIYHVMSYVMSCHVTSRHITLYLIYHISGRVVSYCIVSYRIISCHIISYISSYIISYQSYHFMVVALKLHIVSIVYWRMVTKIGLIYNEISIISSYLLNKRIVLASLLICVLIAITNKLMISILHPSATSVGD